MRLADLQASSSDLWLEQFTTQYNLVSNVLEARPDSLEYWGSEMPEPVDVEVPEGETITLDEFSIASHGEQPEAVQIATDDNHSPFWSPAVPATAVCRQDAAEGSLGYCSYQPPYGSGKCLGSCCVSRGKCSSTSCAANGLGKDVLLMSCYGKNQEVKASLILGNPCANLGCKLHVPGCKDDQQLVGTGSSLGSGSPGNSGGSCVGEIVSLAANPEQQLNPVGKQLLGYPCLSRLAEDDMQQPIESPIKPEEYVYGAWKVCYSSDSIVDGREHLSGVSD
jgi:hypothetical protein